MENLQATSRLLDELKANTLLRGDDWKIIDQRLSQLLLATAATLMKKRPRRPQGVNADRQ